MIVTVLRETIAEFGILWSTMGRTLRTKGATLLLLFTLAWLAYYVTVVVAGLRAPISPWSVIPLMAVGCLAQLLVTLIAYRTAIEEAETSLNTSTLKRLPLIALVSTLLIPFIAAYSAFGFFEGYAHDTVIAAAAMVGSTAEASFLTSVNPLTSTRTLVISVIVFLALWITARLTRVGAEKWKSGFLSLFSAFLSACSVFMVLFSVFRLFDRARSWIEGRTFTGWWDQFLAWLGDMVRIDLPGILNQAWVWCGDVLWPLFWDALSKPILWLTVVALVGGMQFMDVGTVWMRLSEKLPMKSTSQLAAGLASSLTSMLQNIVESILGFLHLLVVALRSGAPFLACLVISYAVVEQAGSWLEFLVNRLLGPTPEKLVLLLEPVGTIFSLLIVPACQAVLLATAFVRLRQIREDTTRPEARRRPLVSIVAGVLAITIAAGIFSISPPSSDRSEPMTPGVPVSIMDAHVTLDNIRIGRSVTGTIDGYKGKNPIPSDGVFVAIRVNLTSSYQVVVQVEGRVGDISYPSWTGTVSAHCMPGFQTTTDMVFEIPEESLPEFSIHVTSSQSITSRIAIGVLDLPSDLTITDVIMVDDSVVKEVAR